MVVQKVSFQEQRFRQNRFIVHVQDNERQGEDPSNILAMLLEKAKNIKVEGTMHLDEDFLSPFFKDTYWNIYQRKFPEELQAAVKT